jgi:uncharacterized protein YqhQ
MQVGGQAVIEGVMMRGPGMVATAVRRADGQIVVQKQPYVSLSERNKLFKLPVLRGGVGLFEMLALGIKSLNYSAEVSLQDADLFHKKNGDGHGEGRTAQQKTRESLTLWFTVVFSLVVGIAIFFVVPLVVTTSLFNIEQEPLAFNVAAGGFRILLLTIYLGVISMMKDIKRLFAYHGAEHKAVYAFERGDELSVAVAAGQSRFHPRCGTSFLLIVMLVAILLFSVLDAIMMMWLGSINIATRFVTHLPLIPLIGGVSYELIKASARRSGTTIGKIIVAPGLWLQRITTKEPDESQLEVALAALRCALGEDRASETVRRDALQEVSLN